MSRHCVLCRRELSPSDTGTIPVGSKYGPVCSACKRHYDQSPSVERQRLDLSAKLYLDSLPKEERQQLELNAGLYPGTPPKEEVSSAPSCPVCGAPMEQKLSGLRIGADGVSILGALTAAQYSVDLYVCPKCGKVELYTAGVQPGGKT